MGKRIQREIARWVKIVVLKTLKDKNLQHLNQEALVSAGLYGYCQARLRYTPDKGAKFKTYAEYRIKGAVLDEVRKMIGDERRKTKPMKRVYNYCLENSGDGGSGAMIAESQYDLGRMWQHLKYSLSDKEIEILQYRIEGYTLKEIADKFDFSESKASSIMSKIKKDAFIYFQEYLGDDLRIKVYKCYYCNEINEMVEKINGFDCDHCGKQNKAR